MWMTLLSFIGGPVVSGLIKAYQAKLAAGNTSEKIASDTAVAEIAAQTAETQSQAQVKIAEVGHPLEPEKIGFYIVLIYMAKVILWDKVFGSLTGGSTDPIGGAVGVWVGLIISWYYGKRTFQNVARILKR